MTATLNSALPQTASARPALLRVEGLGKYFSSPRHPVLQGVSFTLAPGEILGLLGPSGCGKTTLLRIIAGFETPSQGRVELDGRQLSGPEGLVPPERRQTGMVFQDYALFPHLTVADNVAFGLQTQLKSLGKSGVKDRVKEVLTLVGLADLGNRYPHQLSGGQQQRIALARALAPRPSLMLLDEPLSNLDVQVRQRLRHEIRHILKAAQMAAIFVTHDQEEALAIADQIGVMRGGILEQWGAPEDIYTRPASRFVAEFVNQANFLPAQSCGDCWRTELGDWPLLQPEAPGLAAEVMIREEELDLRPDPEGTLIIRDRQFLGREYRYCLETATGCQLHARAPLQTHLPVGARVNVTASAASPPVFTLGKADA